MSKRKPINFELIPDRNSEPHRLAEQARAKYHPDLSEAHIALAWRLNLKPNPDGQITLGKCIKVTDQYKELAAYDFLILLNRDTWQHPNFTTAQKLALLDHELCHAANTGQRDERNRPVWRIRKHDIEEFRSVVDHHGCYKADLELFANSISALPQASLFPETSANAQTQNPN